MTDSLKYPLVFEDLNEEENKLALQYLDRELVRVRGTRYSVVKPIVKYGEEIYNFKPRNTDVWLIGYPRSGTTMMQEILYLIGTNLDYEKAAANVMDFRFPYLESATLGVEPGIVPHHVRLADWKEKRFIKSHFSFSFLHPDLLNVGCKVVYIARNIKDCFLSNYFFPMKSEFEKRKIDQFHELLRVYKKDLSLWGHYFENLKEAWERRNNKNLLFLFYEEVIADKRASIRRIGEFMGRQLTDEELDKLVDHVSVENFKKNKSVNNDHLVSAGLFVKNENFSFIRKGGSGGWREKFSKEMNEEFDEWIRKNLNEIPGFEIPKCWKEAMDL